jgi:hypothetical protein
MGPVEISAIVFACVFGGSILGMLLRPILPEHHLNAEAKDVIKLGVGLIGTMTALVLGLLVASAKGAYDTRRAELTQMAANTILLDRVLAHYGPETAEVRGLLKLAVAGMIDQIWARSGGTNVSPPALREVLFDKLQELVPRTDAQRAIQQQAETMAISIGQTRWLLFEQSGSSIFNAVPGRGRVPAEHPLHQLWLVRAAQRDGGHHCPGQRDVGGWRDIPDH